MSSDLIKSSLNKMIWAKIGIIKRQDRALLRLGSSHVCHGDLGIFFAGVLTAKLCGRGAFGDQSVQRSGHHAQRLHPVRCVHALCARVYRLVHHRRSYRLVPGGPAADVHLTQTYFAVARFHYVMVGCMVSAFLAGLHYWWPKFTGRMSVSADLSDRTRTMRAQVLRLALVLVALLIMLAAEFGLSLLPLPADVRPLLTVPAFGMAPIVAFGFMRLRAGSLLIRAFAVMAIFRLITLLALGSMDPFTRVMYEVQLPGR